MRASAFAIATNLLFTFGTLTALAAIDYTQNISPNSIYSIRPPLLTYIPHFAYGDTTTHPTKHRNQGKQATNHPTKNTKISILESSNSVRNQPPISRLLNRGDIQRILNKQNELKATHCNQNKQAEDLQIHNNLCKSLASKANATLAVRRSFLWL